MTSMAFASMEVAQGPTVGFQGHGSGSAGTAYELFDRVTARREEEEVNGAESSESSSMGAAGESSLSLSSSSSTVDQDGLGDGEGEAQSELKEGVLGSLAPLEECLPIKRGLSNCFAGKSKSFASLAEAAALGSAGSLSKLENPFNKRQRILIACKNKASWQRRASYAALNTSALRALEEEDGDEEAREGGSSQAATPPLPAVIERRPGTFWSTRCFSLTDLQHA
ncbi:hypothetical protein Taro_014074 [Colocasia esculenta]|uniref:Uncharacterized protein n=1 Tax=Colocasia esculenta TaxID=4460 RepID=A0A843U858_COLES|nr:hypothetical protein [Colocasia esculenta]